MTIWRLTIVSITVLILYVGFYPGTMAVGQGFRETSEPGTERQLVAAPGPPAPEANASTLPDAPGVAWQQNGQNTPAPSGAKDGAPAGQVQPKVFAGTLSDRNEIPPARLRIFGAGRSVDNVPSRLFLTEFLSALFLQSTSPV